MIILCFSFCVKITEYLIKLKQLSVNEEDSLKVTSFHLLYQEISPITENFADKSKPFNAPDPDISRLLRGYFITARKKCAPSRGECVVYVFLVRKSTPKIAARLAL